MAACSKYMNRFRKAFEYRGLKVPEEIISYMGKRATSDRSLDAILLGVLNIIEPPYCQKSHCPSHTTFAFCGCSKGLVPGKCKLNLEYLKRKRDREERLLNKRIAKLPDKYLPLSDEIKQKIMAKSETEWQKTLKRLIKNNPTHAQD